MTIRDWEDQLDADKCNWELRSIYADWLNDNGYYRREALQRWLIRYEKRAFCIQARRWSWERDQYGDRWSELDKSTRSCIPSSAWKWMVKVRHSHLNLPCTTGSRRKAENLLMVALQRTGYL